MAELASSPAAWADTAKAAAAWIIDIDDGLQEVDLQRLGRTCTFCLMPVRRPFSYPADRRISGLFAFPSEYGSYHVWHESRAERDCLLALCWSERPRLLATQPLAFVWRFNGAVVAHVPDILIELDDGARLLVDVHELGADADRGDGFALKAALTRETCALLGWSYRVTGYLPRQQAINLEHLAAHQWPAAHVRDAARALRDIVPQVRSIAGFRTGAARRGYPQATALAALWHLAWERQVALDLRLPVRMESPIRLSMAAPGGVAA